MERLSVGFEVKLAKDDAPEGTFSGYGAVFGNEDRGGDVILKGAFRETLRDAKKTGAWPAMLLEHGGGYFASSIADGMPIGIWTSLAEDDTGLFCEGKIALGTQRGKEVYELLKMQPRPAINGLSIGYRAKEFAYGTKPGEPPRTLKKVDLFEVSLVTMPMNPLAMIDAVKTGGRQMTIREFEAFLREKGGFSRADARTAAEHGFKSLQPRDEAGALSGLLESLRGIRPNG
jgi:HK97 family phage prohead protease